MLYKVHSIDLFTGRSCHIQYGGDVDVYQQRAILLNEAYGLYIYLSMDMTRLTLIFILVNAFLHGHIKRHIYMSMPFCAKVAATLWFVVVWHKTSPRFTLFMTNSNLFDLENNI